MVKVLPIGFAPNHQVPLLARFGEHHRGMAWRFALWCVFTAGAGTLRAQANDAFERGSAFYRSGNCDAAISTLRNAPVNSAANLLLGRCYLQQQRYKEAAEALTSYRKSDASDPIALILLAQAMEGDSRGADAARELEEYARRNPAELEIRNALGDLYARLGRGVEAAAQYKMVMDQHPDDPGARIGLGSLAAQEQRWEAAAQEFEKARALVPEDPRVLTGIGDAYLRLQKCEQAVEPLRQALRLTPDDFALAKRTAACYTQLRRWNDVLEVLRTGTPAESADEEATTAVVNAFRAAGNADAAIPYLRAAAPSNVTAHVALGNLLYAGRQIPEARAQYEEAVKLRADLAEINERLGDIAASEKNPVQARKYFEAAAHSQDGTDEVRLKLARVCFDAGDLPCTRDALAPIADPRLGKDADTLRIKVEFQARNWDEAGRLADKLLGIDRQNLEILKIAGEVKLQQNRDPENHFDAAELFEEALKLAPRDKGLRYQIVQIYSNAKDESRVPKARDLLSDYITQIDPDPQALLLLGNVYYVLLDYDNADASFKRGFLQLPTPIPQELSWAYTAYGNMLYEQHRYEDARVQQTYAVNVNEKSDEAQFALALTNLQLKRTDDVRAAVEKLTTLGSSKAAELQALIDKSDKASARKTK